MSLGHGVARGGIVMRLRWAAVLVLTGLVAAVVVCDRSAPAAPLSFDPQHAPIVFIPGLAASELGCGATGSETNIWPRRNDSPAVWASEMASLGQFGFLGLVDVDPGPGVDLHTTGSKMLEGGCGETDLGSGKVASFEPVAMNPLWCLPEMATNPLPVACGSGHSNEYADFALAVQAQLVADGRGQTFVSFPWDWRRPPTEQLDALNDLIDTVTSASGVKATVIAHSFGNTLFREWVDAQGAAAGDRVGRFLSVAGPWEGVATAWTHPAFGEIQPGAEGEALSLIAGIHNVQSVFQSSPGPYWLLPAPEYDAYMAQRYGGGWLAVSPGADPTTSEWVPFAGIGDMIGARFTACPQASAYDCPTKTYYDTARAGTPAAGFHTNGIGQWVGLVGAGIDTPGQICSGCSVWPDGSTRGTLYDKDPSVLHRIQYVSGDGNVPVFSAIQGTSVDHPPGDDVPFFFTCHVSHLDLMRTPEVLARTVPYLAGDAALSYDSYLTREPCGTTPTPPPYVPPQPTPRFTG